MYLVHAALRPGQGSRLPPDLAAHIRSLARPHEAVEHVSVHPDAKPDPVIGIYLLTERMAEAEENARALCGRAVAALAALQGWSVLRVEVPLITPFYEDRPLA